MRTLHCNNLKNAPLFGREVFRLQRPPPPRCNARLTGYIRVAGPLIAAVSFLSSVK